MPLQISIPEPVTAVEITSSQDVAEFGFLFNIFLKLIDKYAKHGSG